MAHNTRKKRETAKSRQQQRAQVYDNNLGEFISSPAANTALTVASFIPGLGIGVKGAQLGYKALKGSQSILKLLGIGRKALKPVAKVAKQVRNKAQSMAPVYVKDKGKVTVANRIIKTKHKNPQRMAQKADGTVKPLTREAVVTPSPTRRIAQIATVPAVGGAGYAMTTAPAKQKQAEPSVEGQQQSKSSGSWAKQPSQQAFQKRSEKLHAKIGALPKYKTGHYAEQYEQSDRAFGAKYPVFKKGSIASGGWKEKWHATETGKTFDYAGRKYIKSYKKKKKKS